MNIAVEIGSYNVRVAVQNRGKIEIALLGDTSSLLTLPSMAFVEKSGQIILGRLAELCNIEHGERVFLTEMMPHEKTTISVYSKLFAFIANRINDLYKQRVSNVMMVVPPWFRSVDPRKDNIIEAWKQNNVNVVNFISSDISVCYRTLNLNIGESTLVFDVGHGGATVSVVRRNKEEFYSISNRRVSGIGGRAFCNLIYSDVELLSGLKYNSDIQLLQVQEVDSLSRLIMERLSSENIVETNVPFTDYLYTISKDKFENMINKPIEESLSDCLACIKDSGEKFDNIKKIVLAGGCSQIPYIEKVVRLFFNTGDAENKKILVPVGISNALFDACKGALIIRPTSILKF